MHIPRVLSPITVTVACLLATLVRVQVTSAYPLHGQRFPHNLAVRNLNSPDDLPTRGSSIDLNSTPIDERHLYLLPSSSEFELSARDPVHSHLPRTIGDDESSVNAISQPHGLYLRNKDGRTRLNMRPDAQIWDPAPDTKPVESPPEWLAFEIMGFPGPKQFDDAPTLYWRETTVRHLEDYRSQLQNWISDTDRWLLEDYLRDLQRSILNGLRNLTALDLKRASAASSSALKQYLPVILKRILVALQMHETPLAWGRQKTLLQENIRSTLDFYETVMRKTYNKTGYDFADYKTLTHQVKLELGIDT